MTLPKIELTRRNKIIIVSVALVGSFAVGRFTVSQQIKTETKIVTVVKEVKVKDTDAKKKQTTHETIITKPDGTTEKTVDTVIDSDKKTTENDTKNSNTNSDTKTEVAKGASPTTISLLGSYDFGLKRPTYGVSVYRPVLGPFGVGIFVMSNPSVGLSLGVSF